MICTVSGATDGFQKGTGAADLVRSVSTQNFSFLAHDAPNEMAELIEQGATLEEVAQALQVSTVRARQIEQRALKKLLHLLRLRGLELSDLIDLIRSGHHNQRPHEWP